MTNIRILNILKMTRIRPSSSPLKQIMSVDNCVDSGLVTPSGLSSVPVGVETPDMIELRKKRIEDAMDQGGDTPALYTILPEKKTAVGAAMMGSAHVYDLSAVR